MSVYRIVGKYVLTYPSGELVGLDSASGGYPYKETSLRHAKLWDSLDEVYRYRRMFHREDFSLHKIESITLTPID